MSVVAVVGTGSWGTMLAVMLTRKGLSVTLWARREEEAEELRLRQENRRFLPGVTLPHGLKITASLAEGVESCHLLFMVVPAQSMRKNIRLVRPHLGPGTVIVSAAKGLEIETALRMSQLLEEELGVRFPPLCSLWAQPGERDSGGVAC